MPWQFATAMIYFFGSDSDGQRAPISTMCYQPAEKTIQSGRSGTPHGSWHRDGRLHHKSFNQKMLPAEARQEPNAEFEGTHNLITRGIASDEPRTFGVPCDPVKFSVVVEIPLRIVSPKHYETYTSIDVSEPGMQPILFGGRE